MEESMSPLTLFTAWLLIASWQMGVPMHSVIVDDDVSEGAWAAYCYAGCDELHYEATWDFLLYNDPTFTKLVAYHEVCHNYLKHDMNKVDYGAAEFEANRCVTVFTGVSMQAIADADRAAHVWNQER
jgi:hypothetical protein